MKISPRAEAAGSNNSQDYCLDAHHGGCPSNLFTLICRDVFAADMPREFARHSGGGLTVCPSNLLQWALAGLTAPFLRMPI